MADTATNSIGDYVTNLAQDVQGTLDKFKPVFGNEGFSSNMFPEDLMSSSQMGHWMSMTAMVPKPGSATSTATGAAQPIIETLGLQNYVGGAPSNPAYTAAFFIPSDVGGGGGMMYKDAHEYADIRLTNLGGNVLGAASSGTVSGASIVPSLLGHPINPGVEVLYRSTALRRFEYSFLLAPSSRNESVAMQSIIRNLRKFAAPKQNENVRFLFDTPAEWVIQFFYRNKPNLAVPKIRRCVLTDINVNYTPQGEWSTFTNGHPVACLLALGFQEMEIITRQQIDNGF